MLKLDGYDEAVIGTALTWGDGGQNTVLVYSADAIVEILTTRDGMGVDEAREFIEFNIEGAYLGAETPIVVWAGFDFENPISG